jgi:putative hemolysin
MASLSVTTMGYSLTVSREPRDVQDAQSLRHLVFAEELGASLDTPTPGLDVDEFDSSCDHLLVRESQSGDAVATYRLLPPGRSARGYSDSEFDLSALQPLRHSLVEAGRSCVHPAHRTGAAINLIWAGIARYMLLTGHRWLAGCASVPLEDGGRTAAGVWSRVQNGHLVPPDHRVIPYRRWIPPQEPTAKTALPPLLRGYLRLGAQVCGPPAHDPEFAVADFFVLLDMSALDGRYLRHFLGETP